MIYPVVVLVSRLGVNRRGWCWDILCMLHDVMFILPIKRVVFQQGGQMMWVLNAKSMARGLEECWLNYFTDKSGGGCSSDDHNELPSRWQHKVGTLQRVH